MIPARIPASPLVLIFIIACEPSSGKRWEQAESLGVKDPPSTYQLRALGKVTQPLHAFSWSAKGRGGEDEKSDPRRALRASPAASTVLADASVWFSHPLPFLIPVEGLCFLPGPDPASQHPPEAA